MFIEKWPVLSLVRAALHLLLQQRSSLRLLLVLEIVEKALFKLEDARFNDFEFVEAHFLAMLSNLLLVNFTCLGRDLFHVPLLIIAQLVFLIVLSPGFCHRSLLLLNKVLHLFIVPHTSLIDGQFEDWLLELILHEEQVADFGLLCHQIIPDFRLTSFPRVESETHQIRLVLKRQHVEVDFLLLLFSHLLKPLFALGV